MDGFNRIQSMWLEQSLVYAPSVEDVYAAIENHRKTTSRKFYFEIVSLAVAFALMAFIFIWVPSVTTTTRMGIVLVIWAILYGVYLKTKSFRRGRSVSAFSAKGYIEYLEEEQTQTCTGAVNEQARAFFLLCAGYSFYIYGWLSEHIAAMVIVYIIMTLIFGLMWFVLRPRAIKKRREKIQSLIKKLETIKNEDL